MRTTTAKLIQIQPNPSRAHRVEDPDRAPDSRRLDCQGYDACLDTADARGWRGFHCHSCLAYRPLTAEQARRDYFGLLELLADSQLLPALAADAAAESGVMTDEDDSDPRATRATTSFCEVRL